MSRKGEAPEAERVYLAGPMRGYPEFNFPEFHTAADALRARGYEVHSPAENEQDPLTTTFREFMEVDLAAVCRSDAVVVLPGWTESQGARLEVTVANECEIPVLSYPDMEPIKGPEHPQVRRFDGGATRDTDEGKFDYEGFFSPLVLRERAAYMHRHRTQSDGTMRDSDNWQRGIPLDAYMKSGWRHFVDVWTQHRAMIQAEGLEDVSFLKESLCALMFNAEGYLHELIRSEES